MKRAFCFIVSLLTLIEMTAQTQDIDIWQGTPVHLSRKVTLRPYLPERNLFQGAAVIVCPGGSYSWHAYKTEGTEVAEWLQGQGIAAFVLKYRVQGYIPFLTHSRAVFGGHQHPDMLEDMQRAIQWLRENA
ncbi:MAG: alpha/beta hydrolase, partial [Alloprevotella sp.]